MGSNKRLSEVSARSLAFLSILVGVICGASCGGSGGDGGGFADGGSSGSSGGGCVGFGCASDDSGGSSGGFGGSSGGSSGGPTTKLIVSDFPGTLPSSVNAAMLKAGGQPGSMKWLYPYDATVFPGGILAPVLQWSQTGTPNGVYVHMSSKLFDYQGGFAGASPTRLQIPQTRWDQAWGQSGGAADPLTVELSTSTGGTVATIREKWTFALGSLKGVVYYNTYTSPQVSNNGAVMRIAPGASAPTAFISIAGTSPFGPCISCHSLSANGSMLVAQQHFYPGGLQAPGSMSFNLTGGATPNPTAPLASTTNDDWGFGGVYPDGSRLLTCGEAGMTGGLFPAGPGNNPGMIGPKPTVMYDTKTGMTINLTGLSVKYAMMPMFSPDGTKVVFNDFDNGNGHSLMVMDFNAATNTFSNPKSIYKDANNFPGWPFFTPDNSQVIFVSGDSSNFASLRNPPVQASPTDIAAGDLWLVNLSNNTAHRMDAADGYLNGNSYLPYPGRDEHLNFYPTVTPVASGGYFWAYFTSRRNYGNMIAGPVTDSQSKKIWVTAIKIGGTPGSDVSAPAFYLPGQELASGNIRAFSALAPCKGNGNSCDTGTDCCTGSCNSKKCGVAAGCSATDGTCKTVADCCDKSNQCYGGFCAVIVQ
jgi:hypothetical protein